MCCTAPIWHDSYLRSNEEGDADSGKQRVKEPKSEAGRRTEALPAAILPDLRQHLATTGFTDPDSDGRLFRGGGRGEPGATPT